MYGYAAYSPARNRGGWKIVIVAAIVTALLTLIIVPITRSYFTTKEVTTEITHKERVCSGSGDSHKCEYLIFTEAGTFKITDALFGTVRFNSSDLYGKVKVGATYEITYYGWRNGFFSMYPNIKSMEEVG